MYVNMNISKSLRKSLSEYAGIGTFYLYFLNLQLDI